MPIPFNADRAPSIPRRKSEAESEPVSLYRASIGKAADGWPILVVRRRWDNKSMFKDFIEIRLTPEQAGEWYEHLGEFFDWINVDPEVVENFQEEQKEAA
jgi:hypothetical protein